MKHETIKRRLAETCILFARFDNDGVVLTLKRGHASSAVEAALPLRLDDEVREQIERFTTGQVVHNAAPFDAVDREWPRLAKEANDCIRELLLKVTRGAVNAVAVEELVEAYNEGCVTAVMES